MEEYIVYRQGIPLSVTGLKINIDKSSSSESCSWIFCKNCELYGTSLLKGEKIELMLLNDRKEFSLIFATL